MDSLDAIRFFLENKKTPVEICIENALASSNDLLVEVAKSAIEQYEKIMTMVVGYQEMLDSISKVAEKEGFQRNTTMFIFCALGYGIRDDGSSPIVGYFIYNTPYDEQAKHEAYDRFGKNNIQGVFLYEIRGNIKNREYEDYLINYKPVIYKNWLNTK